MNAEFIKCMYINGETENAVNMINPCMNGTAESYWSCEAPKMIDQSIVSWQLERPSGDNVSKKLEHSMPNQPINEDPKKKRMTQNVVEGFTNLGEKYVPEGECEDGYIRDPMTNRCIQVCQNCKFNERKYSKSKEFNEFDPCFPNQGVYDGIDNQGNVYCTCGENDRYCGNIIDAQGSMVYNGYHTTNVGNYGFLGELALY